MAQEINAEKVLAAMAEYDDIGPDAFFRKYGGGPSRRYPVCHPEDVERIYPSAVIAQVALGWEDVQGGFSNNYSAGTILTNAGFIVLDLTGDDAILDLRDTMKQVGPTSRWVFTEARVGQAIFRLLLERRGGEACEVTGVTDRDLVRASHIRPWRLCESDLERLDPDNGVLLSALWDAAFDRGLVTFSAQGEAIASEKLSSSAAKNLAVQDAKTLSMSEKRAAYMDWHRLHVFKK